MTPLLFLPGLMCDHRLFTPQIKAIEQDRDVLVGDMTADNTIANIAISVLDAAPKTFALCGLSMGGIVAMEILRQAPRRVERLALLDTNPLAETETVRLMRDQQIKRVRSGQLISVMREEMKPNYLSNGPNRRKILALCSAMGEALGPDVFVRQSRALQTRRDQSDVLQRSNLPTLILCGRDDVLCPVERHELMHNLMPHAELVIVEGAGHLPTLERSYETTKALRAWLEAS